MLSRMVVNDGVDDNRAQNELHGGQTFKGPVRHKGVPVKAHLASDHPGLSCSSALSRCRPVLHRNVFRACPWWRYGSIPVRHDSSWLTVDNPGQLEHGLSIEH